jgi:dipeptidase D
MEILKGLKPEAVFEYFEDICKVPRPSKKEEKIIEYLVDFGKKNNLETKTDECGNILIVKEATPGYENRKTVVLQSHIDMVCEKNSDVEHNFDTDPIIPRIEDGWVKATGTTLGADDGIGIAAQMALLTATDIKHGKIECLFTVDEETGLSGAFGLQPGFFEGKLLLNLDSEDEGELFIGCAGGIDTLATLKFKQKDVPESHVAFRIDVKGLKGGHSGDDIDKGLGNANKLVNRFLFEATERFKIRLHKIEGGNLRNAIAREGYAVLTVKEERMETLEEYFATYAEAVVAEYAATEPNMELTLTSVDKPEYVLSKDTQRDIINALYACPHGVYAMSQQIKGLVETSTNLAAVKFIDDKKIFVTTSQRSSVDTARFDIANMTAATFKLIGADVEHTDGYPGWAPNTDSEILRITEEAYVKLFDVKPIVRAIHAGLECGLFLEKYPGLDMISFGPTIRGAHSPDERLDIETTQKFWDLLIEVLDKTPIQE